MPSKISVLTDPQAFEPKIAPLLTVEEDAVWDQRQRQGDYTHKANTQRMRNNLICQRAQARPEPYLNGLIMLVGSRLTFGPTEIPQCYTDKVDSQWAVYDSPEARWWLDKVLEGLTHMPRSYAMSAATRYFRGIGKQAKLDKPGVGLLSTTNGWKNAEVDTLMRLIMGMTWDSYTIALGAVLLKTEDIGRYSDAAQGYSEEEVDELWETDAIHSATRVERDDEFIAKLRGMLAERGMTPATLNTNPKKAPKPRKTHIFVKGEAIKSRHVRDLVEGTIIQKPDGQYHPSWMKVGKQYHWGGKNAAGDYCYEDKSERPGYGRFRQVSTREMEGCTILRLPKVADAEV